MRWPTALHGGMARSRASICALARERILGFPLLTAPRRQTARHRLSNAHLNVDDPVLRIEGTAADHARHARCTCRALRLEVAPPAHFQFLTSACRHPTVFTYCRCWMSFSRISWMSPAARALKPRHALHHVDHQMKAIQVVQHRHVERRGRRAPLPCSRERACCRDCGVCTRAGG